MKKRTFESYGDMFARIHPELVHRDNIFNNESSTVVRTVTMQVTDACNLNCTYCYQIHKGTRRMTLETGKKFIDMLLSGEKGMDGYINPSNCPAIILDFIGGEPLLEAALINDILEYFVSECIRLDHPWATNFIASISTNGTLYFEPDVQKLLSRWNNHISLGITIDGNKTLHDRCRLFPDGSGSYDIAVAAAKDWMKTDLNIGSKITIAPENLSFIYEALIHMIDLGYHDILANCVYEEGWKDIHAVQFYAELKKFADYFIDNGYSVDDYYCSLFEEDAFKPMPLDDNRNWCGGTGLMLAVDPDGNLYPCLRYMESSLGTDQEPYIIGDIYNGVSVTPEQKQRIDCINCITRRSQSTDECFYCPIAQGCSWCSAYNYQVNGTPDKRTTFICCMHKARALANVYFWNKYYKTHGIPKYKKNHLPDEWALKIVSENELQMLKDLEKEMEGNANEDVIC